MAVGTRLTSKGQVTIPKDLRRHLGLGPGDVVEFKVGPHGGVELRRAGEDHDYRRALQDLRRRKPVRGMGTDEYMALIRDEP